MRLRDFALVFAFAWGSHASQADTTEIFGYEILEAPQPMNLYMPGRSWSAGVGPTGQALGNVLEGKGPSNLSDENKRNFEAGLKGRVKSWLSAVFGISSGKIESVALSDVAYMQIEDVYETGAKGLMLYETITASGIEVVIAKDVSADIDLNDASEKGLEFTVSGESGQVFKVSNEGDDSVPLVVGIKVVKLEYDEPELAQGKLPSGQIGQLRDIGLGYGAMLTKRPSPANGTAQIRFRNPNIVQFRGETVDMSLAEPWVNPVRFSIGTNDSEFVWDLVEMAWSSTEIELFVTRQKLTLTKAASGL